MPVWFSPLSLPLSSLGIGCNTISNELSRKTRKSQPEGEGAINLANWKRKLKFSTGSGTKRVLEY